MTATPFIPGGDGRNPTDGPFQKVVVQLQDNDGNDYDSSNPLEVSGGEEVTNAIDKIAFNLNAAAFSETTNISNDYIFDSVLLNFSTTESKTITITGFDGTILLGGTVDTTSQNLLRNTTKQHFNLIFQQAFNAGDNITVAVTQFTSSGTMDCILKVKQGTTPLVGVPVLGAGDNVIGKVKIVDEGGTATLDVVGDGETVVVENTDGKVTTKLIPIAGVVKGTTDKARFINVFNSGRVSIENLEQRELLTQMLIELRLIRAHQELVTDETIKENEI